MDSRQTNESNRTDVESLHILAIALRKFGRVRAKRHQPIDRFEEGGGCRNEFDTDQIALAGCRGRGFEVAHARLGHRRLAVEHQAHRLDRLDRQRLMGFDQRTMMREIVHTHWFAGIKRSPEGSEHFKSHSRAAISGSAHHHRRVMSDPPLCKPSATAVKNVLIGRTAESGR